MKIVEFLGVQGIGKSALCSALLRARTIGGAWYHSPRELSYRSRVPLRMLDRLQIKALISRHPRLFRNLYARPSRGRCNAALRQGHGRYADFVRACLSIDAEPSPWPLYQLMGLRWLARLVETYTVLDTVDAPGAVVLVEEGFAQRVHALVPPTADAEEHRRLLFEAMPVPKGVVHLSASIDAVVERVRSRRGGDERLTLRHHYLDEQDTRQDLARMAQTCEVGAATLRARGVPVLDVDAQLPVAENVHRIERFLRQITTQAHRPSGADDP